jgi:hypothetical protein
MAQHFGKPIHVWLRGGSPVHFRWNSADYPINEVLSTWRMHGRWWGVGRSTHLPASSERQYYRVRCPDQRVFDLYFDSIGGLWVLDALQE